MIVDVEIPTMALARDICGGAVGSRSGRVISYVHDENNPLDPLKVAANDQDTENKVNIDNLGRNWEDAPLSRSNGGKLSPHKDVLQDRLGPSDLAGSGRNYCATSITLPKDIDQKLGKLAAARNERKSVTLRKILAYKIATSPAQIEAPEAARVVVNLTSDFLEETKGKAARAGTSRTRYMQGQIEGFFEELEGEANKEASKTNHLFSAAATPEALGQRLREARVRKGWTQLQLAQAMGLKTGRSVQELESPRKGQTVVGLHTAVLALDVDGI